MFCKSWPVQSSKEWKLLPSLPPRVEKPWLNAAAIFADMFALVEAAAAAADGGMLEGWLEEKWWGASSKQSSSASTHPPCTTNQAKYSHNYVCVKVVQVCLYNVFFWKYPGNFPGLPFGQWPETFVETHPSWYLELLLVRELRKNLQVCGGEKICKKLEEYLGK